MASWRGLPLVVWCALACAAMRYAGGVWDVAWHRTLGRDSVWSPPHVLLYVAVLGATLASAWFLQCARRRELRRAAGLSLSGNSLMLLSAPLDAFWHFAYGPDTDIWSPPHLLAVFGSGLNGLGWLIAISAWPRPARALCVAKYTFAATTAYAAWFSLNWFQMDAASRDALVYPSLVGLVVLPTLLIIRDVTGLRFGATVAAAGLMLLCLVPAIGFPLADWAGPALPPLLIVPALALDLALRRGRASIGRFVAGGLAFGVSFLVVHGMFGSAVSLLASSAGALAGGLCIAAARRKLMLPTILAEPSVDSSLLGPVERLRFERMRLGVRLGLLIGPTLLIAVYGQAALGPALVAAVASVGSTVLVVFLLARKPRLLLRYQIVCRLIDIVLVWLSVSSVQEFTARAQFDQIYLLPVISATGTHGKRGAYLVSIAATVAVVASRARLVLSGAVPFDPVMAGDALMHISLFFITGSMLDMLMRTSAGVVEQLRRSEKQEAQAALRESEARYRHISELTSDFAFGFRVQPDGSLRCEWVTEAMERMTGYTLADLEQRGGWGTLIHPDDLATVRQWWTAMLQGDASSTDFRIVTRSGNVRELRGHGRALMDELSGQVERIYGAAQDITDRKSWEAALQHQALHDALTDLPNRTLLQNRLAATIAASRRDASSLALLMMDLDHFKEVNDTFGHHLGDLLLQRVGQRLRGSVRASDTVARLGGDEFAVLLPSASTADAQHVAAKLLRVLETPFEIDGHNLKIGASIGVAMCPEHAVDADALQRHADSAMYVAKRLGGGCHLHTPPSEVRQAA